MVRSRTVGFDVMLIGAMDESIKIFGRTLSLRDVTITYDDYGQVSTYVPVNYQFRGIITYATKHDLKMVEAGYMNTGEGLVKISSNTIFRDSTGSKVSDVTLTEGDVIIEGDTRSAGTYKSWILRKQLSGPSPEGTEIGQVWVCNKREDVTV